MGADRRDIYFGVERYNSGTPSGKRLLAHELTHVVQQNNANIPKRTLMPAVTFNLSKVIQ
ncbi:MAG: DUF4157 domain-containing protein [Candidatus Kuenenia sp.]|nr:DUF4157 domain-containing protein [Candidatus Kuenenia hertensis]